MARNLLKLFVLLIAAGISVQAQGIKKFVDQDFLHIMERITADNDTVVAGVQIKFLTITPDSGCTADTDNPVLAYLYLANVGICGEKQLIKFPGSVRWKMISHRELGSTSIEITLTRRVKTGDTATNEEWIVTGNGTQYGIAKKSFK